MFCECINELSNQQKQNNCNQLFKTVCLQEKLFSQRKLQFNKVRYHEYRAFSFNNIIRFRLNEPQN